jgi:hypothetical protein
MEKIARKLKIIKKVKYSLTADQFRNGFSYCKHMKNANFGYSYLKARNSKTNNGLLFFYMTAYFLKLASLTLLRLYVIVFIYFYFSLSPICALT